jgi:integrase
MASIFRRSNGIYYIVTWEKGRRIWRSTGARTYGDAIESLRTNRPCVISTGPQAMQQKPGISEGKKGTDASPPGPTQSLTFSQFVTKWRPYAESNLAPSTVRLYLEATRNLLRILGNHELKLYTPLDIETFKSHRMKEVSPSKTNIDFAAIKAILNVATKWGFLEMNPCVGVKLVKVPPQRPAYLSKDDFSNLIQSIPVPWLRNIICFAVATMMRAGEIANLTWDSVDLKRRFIHVENKDGFRVKTTKPRGVPMNEWVYDFLAGITNQTGYVFTLPDGRKATVDCISKNFKRACKAVNLPKKIHFHSLRHTGATWLVQDGVSIYAVQRLLGHSSIQVTMMYSHLITSEMQDSVNRIVIPRTIFPPTQDPKLKEVIQ